MRDLFDLPPYVRGSDTSLDAAESMVPLVTGLRKLVLDHIAKSPRGVDMRRV